MRDCPDRSWVWRYAAVLVVLFVAGCAKQYTNLTTDQRIQLLKSFERGEARLSCNVGCIASNSPTKARKLLERGEWSELAIEILKVGYDLNLNYYFLGRAAEGIGKYGAAKRYYLLALNTNKCHTGCVGFSFPGDITKRLDLIADKLEPTSVAKANPSATPTQPSSTAVESPTLDGSNPKEYQKVRHLRKVSNRSICHNALKGRTWDDNDLWADWVLEAKRRGFAPHDCYRISTIPTQAKTVKKSPNLFAADTSSPSLPKHSLPTAKSRDTTPPTITIASAIMVKSDNPSIHGRVSDRDRVVQVTVEGRALDLQSNGTFIFSRYVPAGSEETVQLEAIDEWGNKSTKTIKIVRAEAKTTYQLTLAKLNPTTIKGRSNKDAIALVIGVANYSRAPAATYADNDAKVFADYAFRALGIPRSRIKVLTNDKATLTDLKVSIKRWLRGRIDEAKTDVNVFFAGHGLASPDGKNLYLLPYGGETSLLDETALLRRELFDVIGNARPKSATIFLDTCYSGLSRGKETLLASARGIIVAAKPQSIPSGFTVLSAASGQQISSGLDEAKHGLFSYYLMKGMEGDADANKDRKITAGELHAYLSSRVMKQAIRLGREQTPELSGDGERVLVRW